MFWEAEEWANITGAGYCAHILPELQEFMAKMCISHCSDLAAMIVT
jgi:hypothetical protein